MNFAWIEKWKEFIKKLKNCRTNRWQLPFNWVSRQSHGPTCRIGTMRCYFHGGEITRKNSLVCKCWCRRRDVSRTRLAVWVCVCQCVCNNKTVLVALFHSSIFISRITFSQSCLFKRNRSDKSNQIIISKHQNSVRSCNKIGCHTAEEKWIK